MSRPIHKEVNPLFRPHYGQWWLGLRNEGAPYITAELFLACQGSTVDWTAMLLFACVRTEYFKKRAEDVDLFGTGSTGTIHDQCVNGAIHWQNHQDIEEIAGTNEIFLKTYDVLRGRFDSYMASILKKLDGKPNEELPTPPPEPPKPEPVKPVPPPTPDPQKPETPEPEKLPTNWKKIVSILSGIAAIAGTIAALTPTPIDNMVVKAINVILGMFGG